MPRFRTLRDLRARMLRMRSKHLLSATLLLTACGAEEPIEDLESVAPSATILGVSKVTAPVDDATGLVLACDYEASATEFTTSVTLDTAFAQQLTLPFTVRSDAAQEADGIQPLRMSVVWECDANGFAGDSGPLVLPRFDPSLPFCRPSQQSEGAYVGFDVVPAAGPRIAGGMLGIAEAQVVPFTLGSAIDETFRIAALAEQCCFETRASNCDGQSTSLPCTQLTQVFAELDPSGNALRVAVQQGPSGDLTRFQSFAMFNGQAQCARDPSGCDGSLLRGPAYRMRLRGVMEFMDDRGELRSSNEVGAGIDFCRNCGYWNGQLRFPVADANTQCFAL